VSADVLEEACLIAAACAPLEWQASEADLIEPKMNPCDHPADRLAKDMKGRTGCTLCRRYVDKKNPEAAKEAS